MSFLALSLPDMACGVGANPSEGKSEMRVGGVPACRARRAFDAHQPDQNEHGRQRGEIGKHLESGGLVGVAHQDVKHASGDARIGQQPRRIPNLGAERGDDAGSLQEAHRLRPMPAASKAIKTPVTEKM